MAGPTTQFLDPDLPDRVGDDRGYLRVFHHGAKSVPDWDAVVFQLLDYGGGVGDCFYFGEFLDLSFFGLFIALSSGGKGRFERGTKEDQMEEWR